MSSYDGRKPEPPYPVDSDYEERIAELESDNRRMRKVMQRYIDCQDNAKNNWVLDFLQVLEEEK